MVPVKMSTEFRGRRLDTFSRWQQADFERVESKL